ncbi:MAG: glycosyltransferase [Fuerstiella sp.]|nr:glycosyltransferase [Fuerstiella sp.]
MTSTVDFNDVAVIIPALNEEQSLPLVLRDLPNVAAIIVVDNGSHDETAKVSAGSGAIVAEEADRGYGSACLRGL